MTAIPGEVESLVENARVLHLTVATTWRADEPIGTLRVWDTEEAAKRAATRGAYRYVPLQLTRRQEEQLKPDTPAG